MCADPGSISLKTRTLLSVNSSGDGSLLIKLIQGGSTGGSVEFGRV